MAEYRIEYDSLGEKKIPKDVYWGIHTARALENFPVSGQKVHPSLIHAYGYVKASASLVNTRLGYLPKDIGEAITKASLEVAEGKWDDQIVVDALQGGAGTSTNMNINEVIANRALEILGYEKGRYDIISPFDHVNLHQSTNDTYPTALKIAVIVELKELEKALVKLQEAFVEKEKEFGDIVKAGRTELQDAVPMTLGQEFSTFSEAISRDRWRIFKAIERLRSVNLGGTAIGTGIGAPKDYIFQVVNELKILTGLPVSRAENMIDATANLDPFVEVGGMIKACAVNLLKISNDLRLLSSGPFTGFAEINIPPVQVGSSIMPGKYNPVILEMVGQVAILVMSLENAMSTAVALGNLQINQFLPLIAYTILNSLSLLKNASYIFAEKVVKGITANRERCLENAKKSLGFATSLITILGYSKVSELVKKSIEKGKSLYDLVIEEGLATEEQLNNLLDPKKVIGFGKNL